MKETNAKKIRANILGGLTGPSPQQVKTFAWPDRSTSCLAFAVNEPKSWEIAGATKGFIQSYQRISMPTKSHLTVHLDDKQVLMWTVPRPTKEEKELEKLKRESEATSKDGHQKHAQINADSKLVYIPEYFELKAFFPVGMATLQDAGKRLKKGTQVVLKNIQIEHVLYNDGDVKLYTNAKVSLDQKAQQDATSVPIPAALQICTLDTECVQASAVRRCLPLIGNGKKENLNLENPMLTPTLDTLQLERMQRANNSNAQIQHALKNPPLSVDMAHLSDAFQHSFRFSTNDKRGGQALIVGSAGQNYGRNEIELLTLNDTLVGSSAELCTTGTANASRKSSSLHLSVGALIPDCGLAYKGIEKMDSSGILKSREFEEVLQINFNIQHAASFFGTVKEEYLLPAMEELYPVFRGAIFVDVKDDTFKLRNWKDPPNNGFATYNDGFVVDIVTMVLRGGVQISLDFLKTHFSYGENGDACQHGGVIGEDWTEAFSKDEHLIGRNDKFQLFPRHSYSTSGIANLRQESCDYLSKLAKKSPYPSQTAKSVSFFVVAKGTVNLQTQIRRRHIDENIDMTRDTNASMGGQFLIEEAEKQKISVKSMIDDVFGSIYAIDTFLVNQAEDAFGLKGLA